MEKNFILAIVLSVIVLSFFYFFIFPQTVSPPEEEEKPSLVQEEKPPLPEETPPPTEEKEGEELIEEEELILENDYAKIVLTPRGGRIKSWYLKESKKYPKESKKELTGEGAYALGLNLSLPQGEKINLNKEVFQVKKEGERKIIFTWEEEEKRFKLSKSFELSKEGYNGFINIETENLPWGSEYELTWEGGIGEEKENEEKLAFYNGELQREKEEGIRRDYSEGIKWMGLRQKRDFLVLLASLDRPTGGMFISDPRGLLDFWGLKDNKARSRWIIYAGPQDNYVELKSLNNQIKEITGEDYHLTKAINLSLFGHISVGLINILLFFYSFTHNYGIAIILLTLLIYGALSPLNIKQLTSMQKMGMIQPELQQVRKKFKDNPKQLQIETMKLYKKHKVNPLAGCFPLIIRMLIFITLYRALLKFPFSENPFFLWINLGEFDYLLFVLVGGAMFLQQRITQKLQAPQPKEQEGMSKMMQFFPILIIIMFLFWQPPAGVMLYWFICSLIDIIQQFFIYKKLTKKTLASQPG